MTIARSLRKSIAGLTLGAMSVAGIAIVTPTTASASTTLLDPLVPLMLHNLVVSNVTVTDLDEYLREGPYWDRIPQFFNPRSIQPNDRVKVCATVTATMFSRTSPSTFRITGPDYNWTTTLDPQIKGIPTTVCTPYLSLNFDHAAALGLISTDSQGQKHVGVECNPIVLTASSVDTSTKAPSFTQTDISRNCG